MGTKREREVDTATTATAFDTPSSAATKELSVAKGAGGTGPTTNPGIPPIDVDAGITWLYDIDTLLMYYCTPPTTYTKWCRVAWGLYREGIQRHAGPTGEEAQKYYSTPLRGASVVIY